MSIAAASWFDDLDPILRVLLVLGGLLVVFVVVGSVSKLFWKFLLWALFGRWWTAGLTIAGVAALTYFGLTLDGLRWVDRNWNPNNPEFSIIALFLIAGPAYVLFEIWANSDSSPPPRGGGGWTSRPAGSPAGESAVRADGDGLSPSYSHEGDSGGRLDPREGPQQGFQQDWNGTGWGGGTGQGTNTLADEPGSIYGDGA